MAYSISGDMRISGFVQAVENNVMDHGVEPLPYAVSQNIRVLLRELLLGEDPAADGVVDVVVDVGDLVGKPDDACPPAWKDGPLSGGSKIPSRTSFVRFSPLPFFSSTSTTRTLCS